MKTLYSVRVYELFIHLYQINTCHPFSFRNTIMIIVNLKTIQLSHSHTMIVIIIIIIDLVKKQQNPEQCFFCFQHLVLYNPNYTKYNLTHSSHPYVYNIFLLLIIITYIYLIIFLF